MKSIKLEKKLKPKKLKELDDQGLEKILKRCEVKWDEVMNQIKPILLDVKNRRDEALIDYTKKFDGAKISVDELEVTSKEISEAYNAISPNQFSMLQQMKRNILKFHNSHVAKTWTEEFHSGNAILGKQITPVDKAGIYVPGGKYNYPTTAMMGIIPAKVVGVEEIIVVTPPKSNGKIPSITLAAIDMAGASRIFKVGGAQAIASLAYGTKKIPKVDLIVGPGNIYVNCAKRWLSMMETVRIDLPAGPSEILVIADETANPEWIAKDLISQSEHDENACAILITDSQTIANKTSGYIRKLLNSKQAKDKRIRIAKKSFENFGAILLVDDLNQAVEFSNDFAAEHLEIMIKDHNKIKAIASKIKHAGSIFWGNYHKVKNYSTVSMADYNLGTNHILPTGGAAKKYSALSTETFQKISMLQKKVNGDALISLIPGLKTISKAEGLYNMHGLSVETRLRDYLKTKRRKKK